MTEGTKTVGVGYVVQQWMDAEFWWDVGNRETQGEAMKFLRHLRETWPDGSYRAVERTTMIADRVLDDENKEAQE